MWKKILRWAGLAAAGLAVVFAIVVATRDDPIGMMPGRALSGEVVTTPVSDWSFSDEHMLIAVETRPAAPHSVTTICFSHEGDLYVPADRGGSKTWTHFAVSDPRVRVKVGDLVYPVRATRVTDDSLRPALLASARAKYDFAGGDEESSFEDLWVFRMDSAPADVAGAPAE